LVTGVSTSSSIVREEVFGPVLAAMSFRTFDEAVSLTNNTSFGLAASVWTESMSKANEVASRVKCGVVWLNGTNQFDASCGFGGYRESGYGREGGREGLLAYMKPKGEKNRPDADVSAPTEDYKTIIKGGIDQTPKMFIGGAEPRPDSGYSLKVVNDEGKLLGEVGKGNRKDIRNAVEAARKAEGWAGSTGDARGQVLRFIAEKLENRADEFSQRLQSMTGVSKREADKEVQLTLQALFNFAAWAENFEGTVHRPPTRALVPTLNEPLGIVGVACPNEKPLLSMVTMMAANMAAGNRTVIVPSEKFPLLATDLTQVLRASDVPGGVVNIVTGGRDDLSKTLAEHLEVDALWYHGSAEGSKAVEIATAKSNLKQTWTNCGKAEDWEKLSTDGAETLMRRATQVKNIWVPWGEGVGPK
jgi:aldehyde dehydrogenase (NAD+)